MEELSRIPVCIDTSEHARRAGAYAAEELLRDLGLQPRFVRRDELESQGIYYGQDPDAVADGVFRVWCSSEVEEFLRQPNRVSGSESWWLASGLDWDGRVAHVKDPLATAFVWLSGWHEEGTVARDVHGRVRLSDALASKSPCRTPVDDIRRGLARELKRQGFSISPRTWGGDGATWAVALTHDVDALPRGPLGTALRALTRGPSVNKAREQSIDALLDLEDRIGVSATWFVKTARRSRDDARLDLGSTYGRNLVRRLENGGHELGLHPTYFAADHPGYIEEESERFRRVVGAAPTAVRTHYLRWLPATQPVLVARGLRVDSTLGFAESEGFRRGTCHPFRLYDCRNHRVTPLTEMPLSIMDASFVNYQKLSVDEMADRIRDVFRAVRKARGVAVVLWHPAVDVDPDWDDRLSVLEACVLEARQAGAFVGSLAEIL